LKILIYILTLFGVHYEIDVGDSC